MYKLKTSVHLYINVYVQIKKKKHRHQQFLIMFLKSLAINVLPSFPKPTLNTKYSIFLRGPKIWNEILTKAEKGIQSHSKFLGKGTTKLLETRNYWKLKTC